MFEAKLFTAKLVIADLRKIEYLVTKLFKVRDCSAEREKPCKLDAKLLIANC
jgi:hypothetical protein